MQIKYNEQEFFKLTDEVDSLLRNIKDPSRFYQDSKIIMFSDIHNHFNREEGPEGKWTPLKYRAGKILQDTGMLRASVTGVSSNSGAEVGTNKEYALSHQFGDEDKNIPRRTFIFLSEEAQTRIVSQAEKYFWDEK